MKVHITEYLGIDLEQETWFCRCCGHTLVSAKESYKRGLLVHDRDPAEIHPPLIDPEKYEYTFSPDPAYTALLEYYCPHCGTMVETEYLVPGHPPAHDIELDLESLREKARAWGDTSGPREIPVHERPRGCGHHH